MVCLKKSAFVLHYFGKSFSSRDKILPDNTMPIPPGQGSLPFSGKYAFFPLDQQPLNKGQMGLQNGDKIDSLPCKQGFPGGNRVQEESHRDLPGNLPQREVLGHHNEIIAKVQEYLPFIPLWQ